jgi:hypothetical protein
MSGPKRHDSGELPTIFAPRSPAVDDGIDAAMRRYLAGLEEERPTLVPCPRCLACEPCHGTHMVTPALAAQIVNGPVDTEGEP